MLLGLLDRIRLPLAGRPAAAALEVVNRPNASVYYGLLAIKGVVATERPLDGAALRVRCAGHEAVLDGKDVLSRHADGRWRVTLHANTHLMRDGKHVLEAELLWLDGTTSPFRPLRLAVRNAGALAEAVARDLRRHGSPVLLGRVVDSALFPYEAGEARAWFDHDDPAPVPLSSEPARDAAEAHAHLNHWGYCVLHERLPRDLAERFLRETEEAIDSGKLPYKKGSGQRIHNAHRLPAGREIWLYPPVLKFLSEHFRDTPCACQTLTYINGSQQNAHQDTIHLTAYPAGYMCGVWIALQDVVPDSGELEVWPGSHRTTRLLARDLGLAKVSDDYSSYSVFSRRIEELLKEGGYQRLLYRPKVGEILVWHENLIHGGSRRIDKALPRKSIVSHYFARGSVAYYDSRGEAAFLETLV